jgi:hypothetical protein
MSVEEKESLVPLRSLVSSGCRAWPSCDRAGSSGVALLPERGLRLLKGRVRVNPPSAIISPTDRERERILTSEYCTMV